MEIFTGGTDSRYIREVGIPALGFSPMNNTPILLHDHDEFLEAETYLKGIEYFTKIRLIFLSRNLQQFNFYFAQKQTSYCF